MKDFLKKCDVIAYSVLNFIEKRFSIVIPTYFLSFIIGYYLAQSSIPVVWIIWGLALAFISVFYLLCCGYLFLRKI